MTSFPAPSLQAVRSGNKGGYDTYGFRCLRSRDHGKNSNVPIAQAGDDSSFIAVQHPIGNKIFYGRPNLTGL
jgi:hypothetical protein